MKKKFLALLLLILLLVIAVYPALGQDQIGSIRGTVYRDINANGLCSEEGEATLANISLELVNDDIQEIVPILTEGDGTYVFSTIDLGNWQVTVLPGTGWRVTSQQTQDVFLTDNNPDVDGVDFCIIEIESEPTPTPIPTPLPDNGSTVILPESGAPVAPSLLMAGLAGLFLMFLGGIILVRSRN